MRLDAPTRAAWPVLALALAVLASACGPCAAHTAARGWAEPADGGLQCASCQVGVAALTAFLGENATEAEVVALLDNVCRIPPPFFFKPCLALINKTYDVLLEHLQSPGAPQRVCAALGLCPPPELRAAATHPAPSPSAPPLPCPPTATGAHRPRWLPVAAALLDELPGARRPAVCAAVTPSHRPACQSWIARCV